MERFGKSLVFVHLGLSLLAASWAFALYFNRIDWTAKKGQGGQPDGELVPLMAEYDNLARTGIRPGQKRVADNRKPLEFHEAWRPYERAWYATQLRILRGDVAGPIKQLSRGPDGTVLMDPTYGQPGKTDILAMQAPQVGGKPIELKPLLEYDTTIPRKVEEILKETEKLKKEAERDAVATNLLKGPKGLHARLQFEKRKYDDVVQEYKDLRPKWLNNMVELKQLEELRQRLDERVRELTTSKVVSRP